MYNIYNNQPFCNKTCYSKALCFGSSDFKPPLEVLQFLFVLQGLLWCCVLTNSEVLLLLQFPSSFTHFKASFSSQHPKVLANITQRHLCYHVLAFQSHYVYSHLITGRKLAEKCYSIIRLSIRASKWQHINSLFFTHPSVFFFFFS